MIFFSNTITDYSDNYYSDYALEYSDNLKEYNKEIFDRIKKGKRTII